jgi:hypothetical protein
MKATIVAGLVLGGVLASCSQEQKQEEGSGQPDSLTITTPLESKPPKHVVNSEAFKGCVGGTYKRWTEKEKAPTSPLTLMLSVSACARDNPEHFKDWRTVNPTALPTLLDLVDRQGAQEGKL